MKLHIGCGEKFLPGFKHLDVRKYPHIDYVANADDLYMFDDNSLEEIYACHLLEHFPRPSLSLNGEGVLDEWFRVLEPNGVIRIAVPNFEAVVELYLETHNLELLLGHLYGRQNYGYNFHYQAYDFKRLKALLTGAGFVDVQRYDWRDFLPMGYDDYSRSYYPHMDFEHGRLMSLNVVAVKPPRGRVRVQR